MKSSLRFLVAARHCEIGDLAQLASTSALVALIGRLIHALQRERGISNIALSGGDTSFCEALVAQRKTCDELEQQVRERFDSLDTLASAGGHGARLFSRIALALHALDALPALRARIDARQISAADATQRLVRLVGHLLAVVFEAADSAGDPQISRALVAMFNFMQGKEFAGQERALGAGVFARASIDEDTRQQWLHLIDQQQSCFDVFDAFASEPVREAARQTRDAQGQAELERMRRLGCTGRLPGTDAPDRLSQTWYDCCTRRIDDMHRVEPFLSQDLRQLCEQRIQDVQSELRDQEATLEALAQQAGSAEAAPAGYGPQVERSVISIMQEQSRRLQTVSDELRSVRESLEERKIIERAKGLLMAHRQLSEDEAYKALRQMAMNRNRRLAEVAAAVLALADVLPGAQ